MSRGVVAAVASAAGLGCALSSPRPVPSEAVSVVLVVLVGAVVAFAGARAPWWSLAVAGAVAAVAGDAVPAFVLGAAGFVLAAFVGSSTRSLHEVRAVAAGLIVNSLARSELGGFFGASAAIGVTLCVLLVVSGLGRHPQPVRRRARAAAVGVALAAGLATVGLGVAVVSARASLEAGNRAAKDGLDALGDGRLDEATALFGRAQVWFDDADASVSVPWAWPSRLVPLVAQHAVAVTDLVRGAAVATGSVSAELASIDADSVRLVNGRVDLAAIEALAEPLAGLDAAIGALSGVVDRADSEWLVPRVRSELSELTDDLERNAYRLVTAQQAVELAPRMLGASGERRYLVLFTTPAEARGLGGFAGNFAEMVAADGRVSMRLFGRLDELRTMSPVAGVSVVGPEGFLDRYGRFGFDERPEGGISMQAWSNITIPPDMPTVGAVAAELYPQTGGNPVDGVVVVDPFVLQALVGFTGPITVAGWPDPLTVKNTAQVLLQDQYLLEDTEERIDFLEDAARTTFERLLSGSLPGPADLGRVLSPLAHEGRLLMWASDEAERELLRRSSLLGEFPDFDGGDGFGVAVTNGGGSKIDAYLQRSFTYRSSFDEASGVTSGELEVRLTNTAPSSGMPNYVIGNGIGLPKGSSRLLVCVFTPLSLDGYVTVGDDDSPWERYEEFGLNEYCRGITIGPGGTVSIGFELSGVVADPDRPVQVWEQPLVEPATFELTGDETDG